MNVKNSSQNTVKKYEELTFTDDFMFCKVMQNNPDLCKHLIELIIGKKITKCRCKAPCFSNGDIRRLISTIRTDERFLPRTKNWLNRNLASR